MEDPSFTKEWFVTHNGQQFGPVSLDDLKYEAERGELNPRLDMVWKNGMEDWIPSGDIEGLFEKNEGAQKEEKQKEEVAANATDFHPEETRKKRMMMNGKWGGTSRSAFIFLCYIFPFLWILGISYGAKFLRGSVDEKMLGFGMAGLAMVPLIICVIVLFRRFVNLGMSRLWFLGLFVPLLNIWLGSRLFACPEGYAQHRKLDLIGWMLAVLYWVPLVFSVLAVVFAVYTLTQSPPEDPYRETIENFMRKYQEQFKPSDTDLQGNG
ncbi:GYF domain-containing protein [Luteolibacter sp. AS25]|uniref:GYF domain-containing protein n=1 Tax=Luteolibacter sp. AS25 TaxID=3135776 RepID=UPI00398B38D7